MLSGALFLSLTTSLLSSDLKARDALQHCQFNSTRQSVLSVLVNDSSSRFEVQQHVTVAVLNDLISVSGKMAGMKGQVFITGDPLERPSCTSSSYLRFTDPPCAAVDEGRNLKNTDTFGKQPG